MLDALQYVVVVTELALYFHLNRSSATILLGLIQMLKRGNVKAHFDIKYNFITKISKTMLNC